MKIVHIASEFAPIVKAGGLGDVLLGLPRECIRKGENVEVIIPKYDFIDMGKLKDVKMDIPDFKAEEKGQWIPNTMWMASCEGVPLKLLEARHPSGYFHRKAIYGEKDDTARFLYFCRAVMDYLQLKNEKIDILHIHDWHTAICAVLAKDLFKLPIKKVVLTIHNAMYQGRCAHWDLDAIGLNGLSYLTDEKLQDDEKNHSQIINLLKGGIVYADQVTTVSPTYAKEMVNPLLGGALSHTLSKYEKKLKGIINGLDLSQWNPGFSKKDPIKQILEEKAKTREAIKKKFSLKGEDPCVGAITRLVYQKGPELIEEAIHETIKQKGTFFLLGSPSTPEILAHFKALKKKYEKQALFHLEYDDKLAHDVYKALHFIVIPSRYEPCGLVQMIAMHHGTIPIARATGGHVDTIFDENDPKMDEKKKNGFLFSSYSKDSMQKTIDRAFDCFRNHGAHIENLMQNGLSMDWSWDKPAQKYLDLYRSAISTMR